MPTSLTAVIFTVALFGLLARVATSSDTARLSGAGEQLACLLRLALAQAFSSDHPQRVAFEAPTQSFPVAAPIQESSLSSHRSLPTTQFVRGSIKLALSAARYEPT